MTLELAQGLRGRGHSAHIIFSSWNNHDFPDRVKAVGLWSRPLPLGFISATLKAQPLSMTVQQLLRWPSLLFCYGRHLRSTVPRWVIHTNWHHICLLLPYLRSDRDLFWLHEVIPNSARYRAVFQKLEARLMCFVAVSQAVGNSLRRLGIPEHKIRVIHNGLSDPAMGSGEQAENASCIRVGIVGQIAVWKGHDDLLQAFSRVAPGWSGAELHIFGHGAIQYEDRLREKAISVGLAGRVTWHGFLKDRRDIFRRIDICVVPSRSDDPFPTVAIEAAAFGLPVIATQRGGLPEIIVDGVTGILVRPGDPEHLAEAIVRLLADARLRRSMGERARDHVRKRFSLDRFIADFLNLLEPVA